MGRIYPIASFETTRCIGIVRTMTIFEHLVHLRICVMRCFGIVRTIPTSSSSCSLSTVDALHLCGQYCCSIATLIIACMDNIVFMLLYFALWIS